MKSKLLLICLVPLVSLAVKAQPRIVDRDEEVVYRNSSAFHRLDKGFDINAILLGVGPSISSTTGVQVGKFLTPKQQVLLELTSGKLSSWGSSISQSEITTKSLGLHYKHYAGNSFYWRLGGDYRTADYKYQYNSSFDSSYNALREFSGNSFALNVQIGNQWQWENFTLGCDWIGWSMPIASQVTSERVQGDSLDYEYLERDQADLLKNGHLNLLRFYLGISF